MQAYKHSTKDDERHHGDIPDVFLIRAQQQQKTTEKPFDLFEESISRVFHPFRNIGTNNDSLKDMLVVLLNKFGEAQYNSIEALNKGKICNNCQEEIKSQTEDLKSKIQSLLKEKDDLSELNQRLERENDKMVNILKHSLPTHSIVFAGVTSFAFVGFLILYLLQLVKGLYLIHPFISFSGLIGSGGLFLTAILSIKDWKEWISNNEK